VKRSLALTAILALAALAGTTAPAVAQTPTFVRGVPLQVTRTTTPARDRTRPYTFTTRGRIVPPSRYCPPGQSPLSPAGNCIPVLCPPGATDIQYCFVPGTAVICSGFVNIRFQKRGTTISSRNVTVRPDCTYRGSVTFHTLLALRRGVLTVRARFGGNLVLRPKSSNTGTVRAG
jgi:hypothetical protein